MTVSDRSYAQLMNEITINERFPHIKWTAFVVSEWTLLNRLKPFTINERTSSTQRTLYKESRKLTISKRAMYDQ